MKSYSAVAPVVGLFKFGECLLKSEDLDPVYIMLTKSSLTKSQLKRWLLAYWMFYHVGVASRLAQTKSDLFYSTALELAKDCPRGKERRHFRGKACKKALNWFAKHYPIPEDAVDDVAKHSTCQGVVSFVKKKWPLFGSMFGFKIADMLERVLGKRITFEIRSLTLYDSPLQAARYFCDQQEFEEVSLRRVVKLARQHFKGYKAPPSYDRGIRIQEIETMLCKWNSHLKGKYPIGENARDWRASLKNSLKGWGSLADNLSRSLDEA